MESAREFKFTLTLNEREANWLKQRMQNPLPHVERELKEDAEMRRAIWNALRMPGEPEAP